MKSIKHILSIWSIMFVIAFFISSCCQDINVMIIGEGKIESLAMDRSTNIVSDSITGPFRINITLETETVFNDIAELGFAQGLATSCEPEVLNRIDPESVEILFDKDFQYNNSNFESDNDLTSIVEIKSQINIYTYEIVIDFNADFLSKATFETGDYNLKINYKTSDDVSLSNDIDLRMNI